MEEILSNFLFEMSSNDLDHYYGFRINEIEDNLLNSALKLRPDGSMSNFGEVLHHGHQTWVGLDPQVLNTPYRELAELILTLMPGAGEHFVDLGAGYGRMGLVLKELCPETSFTGFEIVRERVAEGNRVLSKNSCHKARLLQQDLTSEEFIIPEADYYFLYDYGKVSHIRHSLKQIEAKVELRSFKVIARGKGSRSIIEYEHPWLSQVKPVEHFENFSIYST